MPSRALQYCLHPGCTERVRRGRCSTHETDQHRQDIRYRGTAQERGYDGRWKRIRDSHVRREPLCRACEAEGRITAVDEVDHVIPHRMNGTLLRSHWNLQSLCRDHHAQKTASEEGWWTELLWPLPTAMPMRPITVVSGAPGSGKTTYVDTHASPTDSVIDVDEFRGLGNLPEVLAERNRRIRWEARQQTDTRLWFITTGKRSAERAFWRWALQSSWVTLTPGREECERRIRERGRNVTTLLEAAGEWWRWYEVEASSGESPRLG